MQPHEGPVPASSLEMVLSERPLAGPSGAQNRYRDVLRVLCPREPPYRASEGIFGPDVKRLVRQEVSLFMSEVRYWQYLLTTHGSRSMEALERNVYLHLRRQRIFIILRLDFICWRNRIS